MLRGEGNQMFALLEVGFGDSFDGQIVSFRRAAGEDNLFWQRTDRACNDGPCLTHSRFCRPAVGMPSARRITKVRHKKRHHRRQDFRRDRGCGMMVQVNRIRNRGGIHGSSS